MTERATPTGDADAPQLEGVDGTVVAYRERLFAPWWVWALMLALTGSLGIAYGFPLGAPAGWLVFVGSSALAAWWLVATAPLVVVDDLVLRAGRARLPLRHGHDLARALASARDAARAG